MDTPSVQPTRFVGFDVHKDFIVASAVDARQTAVLGAQKVRLSQVEDWMRKHLGAGDAVLLEASANAWHFTTCCCIGSAKGGLCDGGSSAVGVAHRPGKGEDGSP